MTVDPKLVTVAEFLQIPTPSAGHYDLHHGKIILVTPPKWGHQRLQGRIETLLQSKLASRAYGVRNMPFQPAVEYEVWEADVGAVLLERADAVPDDEYLAGSPELVVEVKSSLTSYLSLLEKAVLCLKSGAHEFRIVEPDSKTIIVLYPDRPLKRYTLEDEISCGPLLLEISVQDVFST